MPRTVVVTLGLPRNGARHSLFFRWPIKRDERSRFPARFSIETAVRVASDEQKEKGLIALAKSRPITR